MVTCLEATVSGTSGSLNVVLTWDEVPGVLGYGIHYNGGSTVIKNDRYRVSYKNDMTLTGLTGGQEFTFA